MAERLRNAAQALRNAARALRAAAGNPELRTVLAGYFLFEVAEYTIWIGLLVYAFGHGGATGSLVIALVQLVPSAALAPVLGALTDLRRPDRVLVASYVALAATSCGLGVAIVARFPAVVVFLLAPLTTASLTASRPAQAALLPALVRTPDELTAANVMTGWGEAVGNVGGPALAGVLIALHGAALAIEVSAAMMIASSFLAVAGLRRAPLVASQAEAPAGQVPPLGVLARNAALVRQSPATLVLVAVHGYYYLIVGAVEIIAVVLATSVLHLGLSGVGYLTTALGGGTLLAGAVTVTLVGRIRLAGVLLSAMVAAGVALGVLGLVPRVVDAFVLLTMVGLAGSVFDVTGRTLLQRAAPADSIAGAFSLLEGVMNLGIAIGALVARGALALGGARVALLAVAALTLLAASVCRRPLRAIDASAIVPQVEIRLLRSIPIFAALPTPALEGVARELVGMRAPAGTVVVREGDAGDRYYAIADGDLAVTRQGRHLATLSRGEGFGEIALVHDVPRTATVTAVADCLLYGLDQGSFRAVVTGWAPAGEAARALAARRAAQQ